MMRRFGSGQPKVDVMQTTSQGFNDAQVDRSRVTSRAKPAGGPSHDAPRDLLEFGAEAGGLAQIRRSPGMRDEKGRGTKLVPRACSSSAGAVLWRREGGQYVRQLVDRQRSTVGVVEPDSAFVFLNDCSNLCLGG